MIHCQIQVSGPDSKAVKSKYTAFHLFFNGRTTLSSSGVLALPSSSSTTTPAAAETCLVLAPITCLFPFIQATSRRQLTSVTCEDLIPSVDISIALRPADLIAHSANSSNSLQRYPARLHSVLQLPAVQAAAEHLLMSANASSAGDWKLGWGLADQQPLAAATPAILAHMAVLQVDLSGPLQQQYPSAAPEHNSVSASRCTSSTSSSPTSPHQGQPVTITGSPFGCLAEQQFYGAVVSGCISLLLQQQQLATVLAPAAAAAGGASASAALKPPQQAPLFVVDARCMPGMEGGPVCCRCCGAFLGVLGVPLSNSSSQVELFLAITAAHLAAAAEARLPQIQHLHTLLQNASGCSCNASSSSSSSSRQLADPGGGLHRRRTAACDAAQQQPHHYHHQQQKQQHASPPLRSVMAGSSAVHGGPVRRLQVHLQHLTASGCEDPPSLHQHQHQQEELCSACDNAAVPTPAAASNHSAHQTWAGSAVPSGSSSTASIRDICSGTSTAGGLCLQAAAAGVVMVRVGSSWGSGVLVSHTGLVLTVAHLFRKGAAAAPTRATAAAAAGGGAAAAAGLPSAEVQQSLDNRLLTDSSDSKQGSVWQAAADSSLLSKPHLYPLPKQRQQQEEQQQQQVSIRVTFPTAADSHGSSSSSESASGKCRSVWVPARVVYCFTGYLDLAVLQVTPAGMSSLNPALLQPLRLVRPECDVTPGDDAFVIGHGLFGPRMGLSPAITAGCVAREVAVPPGQSNSSGHQQKQQQQQGWKPSMVISTAAVHSGASGGALVDAAGRLAGLVTSNARHVRGQTLPHFNFCISASELRPVWDWAQQQQDSLVDQAGWKQLRALDVESAAGAMLWALQPYLHKVASAAL